MIKIIKKIPLHSCVEDLYTGAIYTGNSYKFLAPLLKKIDIFTCKLNKVTSKNVCDPYEFISNSKCPDEYLVIKKNDYENIYIFDNKYNELCTIKLKVSQKYLSKINSISFDNDSYKIYIALDNMVYSVTLGGDFIKEEISKCALDKMRCSEEKTINYRCCNVRQINNLKITSASYICNNLVVSYIKNSSAYLSEISESGNIIETYYVDDDVSVDDIFLVKGKVEMLVTKQKKYNYIYVTDVSCCNKKKCVDPCELINMCECKVNNNCCKPDKPKDCKEDVCDIIESIALIETAISHILNAEGEKIQKAVKIACKCDDLIKVNDSVARTITNVTMLETVLTDKLSMALECTCKKDCR